MVPLTSLVVPIFGSAVLVFVASSIIHMVLTYHRSDFRTVPSEKEAELLAALRRLALPPGEYVAPHAGSAAGMKDPAFIAKMKQGPLVMMSVSPGMEPSLGKPLSLWFLYIIVVTVFAAYVTGRAVGPGTPYPTVFRFIGTTGFMGYSLGLVQNSIWFRRNAVTTAKSMFDGLVYASLTAGMFGWLWPR
jgi:hypothetical protein